MQPDINFACLNFGQRQPALAYLLGKVEGFRPGGCIKIGLVRRVLALSLAQYLGTFLYIYHVGAVAPYALHWELVMGEKRERIDVDQEAKHLFVFMHERGLEINEGLGVLATAIGHVMRNYRVGGQAEFMWRRTLQGVHEMIDEAAYAEEKE